MKQELKNFFKELKLALIRFIEKIISRHKK